MLGAHHHRAAQEMRWDPTPATKNQDPMKLAPTAAMKNHGGTSPQGAGTAKPAPGESTHEWKENAYFLSSKMSRIGFAKGARDDQLVNVDIMNTLTLQANVAGLQRNIELD